jgi:hypothetical protein
MEIPILDRSVEQVVFHPDIKHLQGFDIGVSRFASGK